jgi:hypothetical protein
MVQYGILKDITNTGSNEELSSIFSAPVLVISNSPSFNSDSMSLRRASSSQGVQRWEIEAELMSTVGDVNYFLHSILNSTETKIYIRMPALPNLIGLIDGKTLTLGATILKGATDFNVNGLTGAQLVKGEFIQFDGDNKVYVVMESGVDGVAASLYPPVRTAKLVNTPIKYGKLVTMHGRYDTNNLKGFRIIDGLINSPGNVRIIEDL